MIKQVKIYDMDGTIVDSTHRYRTVKDANGVEKIDLDFWRANEFRAFDDSLLPLAAEYQADLKNPEIFVIIATARVMGDADWKFVNEKLGKPNAFISRKNGDTTSGGKLKIRGLVKYLNLKQFKNAEKVFFEDNMAYLKTVCDFFKIKGVYCPSMQGH